jgi:hypothetical protein
MKDLDTLLGRVLERAAACPEPTALRYLRDAAIEFCRRTRVWRESDSFTLSGDDAEVLAVEPGAVIYEISHARLGDIDLEPVTIDWLDAEEPGWRDDESGPRWITQSAPGTLRVAPAPDDDDDDELTVQLILIPSQDADQLPDFLVDDYPNVLADGALAKILALPADFGNPQLAIMHAQLFEAEIGRFGARVPRGQQRAPRRVKAHWV